MILTHPVGISPTIGILNNLLNLAKYDVSVPIMICKQNKQKLATSKLKHASQDSRSSYLYEHLCLWILQQLISGNLTDTVVAFRNFN